MPATATPQPQTNGHQSATTTPEKNANPTNGDDFQRSKSVGSSKSRALGAFAKSDLANSNGTRTMSLGRALEQDLARMQQRERERMEAAAAAAAAVAGSSSSNSYNGVGSNGGSEGRDSTGTASTSLPASLTAQPTVSGGAAKYSFAGARRALPEDYELPAPVEDSNRFEHIEKIGDLLFSTLHLQAIFDDPPSLLRFTSFLRAHRPYSLPTLVYYLDASKAVRAMKYANAVARALEPVTAQDLKPITSPAGNPELEGQVEKAFDLLAQNDLPPFVASMFTRVVMSRMIIPVTRVAEPDDAVQGFAEVFCLTDPRRKDNPIIFASPAFHQMTQYSMNYIIGRNCRFLQGPKTNPDSPKRIRKAIEASEIHWEVFINYRRDGSPFLNLLMCAPLFDEWGKLRYNIGAQIDVSGVIADSPELESLQRTIMSFEQRSPGDSSRNDDDDAQTKEFQALIEMLDIQELKAVRTWEERLLQLTPGKYDKGMWNNLRRPGIPLSKPLLNAGRSKGLNLGLYNKYLLVRPYPSLKILFASPSLSRPGVIQTSIMEKISTSGRVTFKLKQSLEEGREITAKVGWRSQQDEEVVERWIVFTPMVGRKGQIGVWMVILEDHVPEGAERREPSYGANRADPSRKGPMLEDQLTEEDFGDALVGTAASTSAATSVIGVGDTVGSPVRPNVPYGVQHAQAPVQSHLSNGPATTNAAAAGAVQHRSQISWSGPEVPADMRSPALNWAAEQAGRGASNAQRVTVDPGFVGADLVSDEYVPLEERLRRKREREGGLVVGMSASGAGGIGSGIGTDGAASPVIPMRRTYKSLSPETFISPSGD